MSHIAAVKVQIKDLECLKKAAERCGLEFREGQQTFRMFTWDNGQYLGDAYQAMSELGISKDDFGKCEHALACVNGIPEAYEVGIVRHPGGGYALLFDPYSKGFGLMDRIASDDDRDRKGAGKLLQFYSAEVAKKAARRQGFSVQEVKQQDGSIKVMCRR